MRCGFYAALFHFCVRSFSHCRLALWLKESGSIFVAGASSKSLKKWPGMDTMAVVIVAQTTVENPPPRRDQGDDRSYGQWRGGRQYQRQQQWQNYERRGYDDRGGSRRRDPSPMSSEEEREEHIVRARKRLQRIDSEYANFVRDKQAKESEQALRSQGAALAEAMRSTLEDHLEKVTIKRMEMIPPAPESGNRGYPGSSASAPAGAVAAPDELTRAEKGWLQSLLGAKFPIPENKSTVKDLESLVEKAMND